MEQTNRNQNYRTQSNSSEPHTLSGQLSDMKSKSKDFFNEEKRAIQEFGADAQEKVETFASDAQDKIEKLASDAVSLIRKNPAIAVAAAVTVGLIVAKIMQKSTPHSHRVH